MANKKKLSMHNLSLRQVRKLRKQIVLNSLYVSDYENSYGIDPHAVQSYFDGFVEYLCEVARTKSPKHVDSMTILLRALDLEKQDPSLLKDYYHIVDVL